MKRFLIIIFLIFIIFCSVTAGTQFYRCTFREDPSTSIVISWCDKGISTNAQLYYGTLNSDTNWSDYPNIKTIDRTTNFAGLTNRFVRLSGLSSNTIYYFVIHDAEGTSRMMSFRTLSDMPENPILFISGADSRDGMPTEYQYELCRTRRQNANILVSKIRPDFVAFQGDFVYYSFSDSLWNDWMADWQLSISPTGRLIPFIPTNGNHESSYIVNTLFDVPSYFALNIGGGLLRLYSISSDLHCDSTMLSWFTNDLKQYSANKDEPFWKAIQYHYALMPHAEYQQQTSLIGCWTELFKNYKIRLAMEGHCHVQKITYPIVASQDSGSYMGFKQDNSFGTVYIGEGGWGAPFRDLYTYYDSLHSYKWTEIQDRFAGFNIIRLTKESMEIMTAKTDNAAVVEQINDEALQAALPENLDLWLTPDGYTVKLLISINNIKDGIPLRNIRISPNPFTAFCNIYFNQLNEDVNIDVYNILGIKIISVNVLKGIFIKQIDAEKTLKGIYFVKIRGKSFNQSFKVIKT